MSEEATLDDFTQTEEENVKRTIEYVPESSVESSLDETSVGDIPDDWVATRLRDIAEETEYGLTESAEEYAPDKPRYIRTQDFDDYGGLKPNSRASLSREKAKDGMLEEGDLLFARSGSVGASLGKTYLYDTNDGDCCFGGYSIRHRLQDEGLNHKYLSEYTLSEQYWDWVRRRAKTTAQSNINTGEYGSLLLPIPPLPEQRKIATVLYTVDRAIKKTEEVIKQTERLRNGVMQNVFSRGVRSYNDFQETKYGAIPTNWEFKPVREIAERIGSGGTPNTDKDEYYNGDIEWVKTDDLNSGLIESVKTTITSKGLDESAAKLFPEGTVVFAMYGGSLGQNGRLGMEAAMNQACCGIVTDESEMNSYFLHQQLIHRKKQLTALSAGTHQQNISQSMIEKFEVFVPPLDEQMEMMDILRSIEGTIETNTNEKERLKHLKRGLMQDHLSGTVRTNDTNIEVPEEVAQYG